MALGKTIIFKGFIVNNAYYRIDTVSGYKGGLNISVNVYTTQQAFLNGENYLEQQIHSFIPSVEVGSENFIKQGYEYLKTLPEFIDAIDC